MFFRCVLSAPYYTCISGNMGSELLLSLDVTSNAVQLLSKPLSQYIANQYDNNLRALDGNSIQPGFIAGDKKIVLIKNNDFVALGISIADPSASVALVDSTNGPMVLQTWSDDSKVGASLYCISSMFGRLWNTTATAVEIRKHLVSTAVALYGLG